MQSATRDRVKGLVANAMNDSEDDDSDEKTINRFVSLSPKTTSFKQHGPRTTSTGGTTSTGSNAPIVTGGHHHHHPSATGAGTGRTHHGPLERSGSSTAASSTSTAFSLPNQSHHSQRPSAPAIPEQGVESIRVGGGSGSTSTTTTSANGGYGIGHSPGSLEKKTSSLQSPSRSPVPFTISSGASTTHNNNHNYNTNNYNSSGTGSSAGPPTMGLPGFQLSSPLGNGRDRGSNRNSVDRHSQSNSASGSAVFTSCRGQPQADLREEEKQMMEFLGATIHDDSMGGFAWGAVHVSGSMHHTTVVTTDFAGPVPLGPLGGGAGDPYQYSANANSTTPGTNHTSDHTNEMQVVNVMSADFLASPTTLGLSASTGTRPRRRSTVNYAIPLEGEPAPATTHLPGGSSIVKPRNTSLASSTGGPVGNHRGSGGAEAVEESMRASMLGASQDLESMRQSMLEDSQRGTPIGGDSVPNLATYGPLSTVGYTNKGSDHESGTPDGSCGSSGTIDGCSASVVLMQELANQTGGPGALNSSPLSPLRQRMSRADLRRGFSVGPGGMPKPLNNGSFRGANGSYSPGQGQALPMVVSPPGTNMIIGSPTLGGVGGQAGHAPPISLGGVITAQVVASRAARRMRHITTHNTYTPSVSGPTAGHSSSSRSRSNRSRSNRSHSRRRGKFRNKRDDPNYDPMSDDANSGGGSLSDDGNGRGGNKNYQENNNGNANGISHQQRDSQTNATTNATSSTIGLIFSGFFCCCGGSSADVKESKSPRGPAQNSRATETSIPDGLSRSVGTVQTNPQTINRLVYKSVMPQTETNYDDLDDDELMGMDLSSPTYVPLGGASTSGPAASVNSSSFNTANNGSFSPGGTGGTRRRTGHSRRGNEGRFAGSTKSRGDCAAEEELARFKALLARAQPETANYDQH